jgi:hypothetical protein
MFPKLLKMTFPEIIYLNKIALFCVFTFCLAILSSCSDSPTSVGNDIVKRDLVSVSKVDSYTDTLSQTSSYFKNVPKPGLSATILIGKADNVEAKTLISFDISLADSLTSDISAGNFTVTDATVQLRKSYVFGDSLGLLNFNGYECTSGWTSVGFTSDSLSKLTYNSTNVISNIVPTDTTLSFDLDKQLVTSWLTQAAVNNSVTNNGIFIDPSSNSQKIVGYQSQYYSNTYVPELSVAIQRNGTSYTDTLLLGGYQDVSVVVGNLPQVSAQNIAIQGGLAVRAKLKFNLSKVPSNVILNNAELVLKLDSLETELGSDSSNTIVALKAAADTSNNAFDSTQAIVLTKSGNTISGDITSYVQQWLKGNNYGFILSAQDEIGSTDLFSVYGSNFSNRKLRPRLTIYYTYKK